MRFPSRSLLAIARVSLTLFLAGASVPLVAQAESPWPIELQDRARELVMAKWGVSAEQVVMAWGPYRGEIPAAEARLVLLGTGGGGYWVVRAWLWNGTTVSVRLRTGRRVELPVAARVLKRGEILAQHDIVLAQGVVWDAPGEEESRVAAGWEVQRAIEEGGALRPPAVRLPLAVVSGRDVRIVWTRGTIGLSAPGRAAGSGAVGDRVFVRTEAGTRLSGIVVALGVVDVSHASLAKGPGGRE